MSHLELVVPQAEQEKWLRDMDYAPLGAGATLEETNPLHRQQFWKLLNLPEYDAIMTLATRYIQSSILYPLSTLQVYWSTTCFTEPDCYFRINMADQLSLTVTSSIVYWTVHEILEPEIDISALASRYNFYVHRWGKARISLRVSSLEAALEIVDDRALRQVVRQCNLFLMQKKNLYANSHNFALAEALLTPLQDL